MAVYAELAGSEGVPQVRAFLKDADAGVRTLAVGVLARARDSESLPSMVPALEGADDGWLAFRTIQALGEWDDPEAVLPLMALLQNDKPTYTWSQDNFSNVALNARAALQKKTRISFPLDTELARKAWEETRPITDLDGRRRRLEEVVGSPASPIAADIVNRDGKPLVIVRNRSKKPVVLARRPQDITLCSSGGVGGAAGGEITGRESFIELPPDGTTDISVDRSAFLDTFLYSDRSSREIVLEYLRNGNEFGIKAWMGVVVATCGENWKEPARREGITEERWPGGGLKARGNMVDGRKHGPWTYWHEDGRKKAEWEWFNGTPAKMTEFNSEAPEPEKRPESDTPPVTPATKRRLTPLVVLGSAMFVLLVGAGSWRRRKRASEKPP